MAKARSLDDKQHYKIVNNQIINSPIKNVVLVDNTDEYYIALHGQNNQNCVYVREQDKLKYFLDFIKTETGNDKIISDNIEEAIQNFRPEDRIKNKASLLYTKMADVLEQKLTQAQQENKKLLILIGDIHDSWDSGLLQLIALDICKKNNIEHFWAELSENYMKDFLSYNSTFWGSYMRGHHSSIICRTALKNGMSLHAGDPLVADWLLGKLTFKDHGESVVKTILSLHEHSIFPLGKAHIKDMISNDSLKSKVIPVVFQTEIQNISEINPILRHQLEEYQKHIVGLIKELPEGTNNQNLSKTNNVLNQKFLQSNLADTASITSAKDNEEIIILPLKEKYEFKLGESSSLIPSDIDAINIAIDTISKHNPNSKTLNSLQHTKLLVEKIRDTFFKCPSNTQKFKSGSEILTNGQNNMPPELGKELYKEDVDYFAQHSPILEFFDEQKSLSYFYEHLIGNEIYNSDINDTVYPKE